MGTAKKPLPVKLIASLLYTGSGSIEKIMDDLDYSFGQVDFISEPLDFSHTNYYSNEMGSNLKRKILSFEKLIDPDTLPEFKIFTNGLEQKYLSTLVDRPINIDPGYLNFHHLILATTKSYAHRPYLTKGIYADLTLIFRAKTFHPLDWTYPDYSSEPILEIMEFIRKKYVFQMRGKSTLKGMREETIC
ncbi:MAG: DUF4416 family protein [Thermodesulfobacteriota bacterium]|nr:DUF4416 family protein [Thermodesulfobacteriota bacterium]